MSEEVANAAPVSAPEAAPATSAPVADVSAAPTTSAPSGENSAPPDTPQFSWSTWNGDHSALSEEHLEAYTHLSDKFKSDYKEREEEIDSLRSMYAAMLNEEEDPRISDLSSKLEELQKTYNSRNSEFETLQQEFGTFMEKSATEYVDRFWKDHQELSQDQDKLALFIQLIDEESENGQWEGYAAAELLSLSEGAQKIAFEAKKDGVSDVYALKLAKAHAQLEEAQSQPSPKEVKAAKAKAKAEAKAKAPRRGAKITNGATSSSNPRVAKESMGDASSLDDLRNLAARRALRVHGGGKS